MESYQFIKQIGHGTYSDVWLVKCSKTRKKYVLKRIDLQWTTKREQRAAHLETKLLSTIKHPHIVTYLDSFYDSKGSLFIVMGYYEFGDLCTYIRKRNGVYFEENEVIHWFVQICMALKCLHDKNIFHRNLKTCNIFLTKNKLIKVGDAGIAQTLTSSKEMASTLIGIPCYMSPEIVVGKPFTQKSDIWALGCCIYEIATLKHAFTVQDRNNLIQKVIKKKVTNIPNTYSMELSIIISSMFNYDPEKRPCVTELLLNDYVRKYIVLFLKDNPERFLSLNYNKCKFSLPNQRSKSGFCESKPISDDKSLATEKEEIENEDMSDLFTTIPDINGNGDGNDNSQQRKISQDGMVHDSEQGTVISENMSLDTSSSCSGSSNKKIDIENYLCLYKNCTETNNPKEETSKYRSISQPCSLNKMDAQKMRSEHSFQILNDLRNSLRNTRLRNFEGYTSEVKTINPSSKIKYLKEIKLPKSAEESSSYSKISSEISKRTVASARNDHKNISNDASVALPPLKKSEIKNITVSKDSDKIDLPLLTKPKVLYFEDCTKTHISQDLYDHNIDKILLKKIMECN